MDYSVKRKELFAYIDIESILGYAIILSLKSNQFFTFSLFLSLKKFAQECGGLGQDSYIFRLPFCTGLQETVGRVPQGVKKL